MTDKILTEKDGAIGWLIYNNPDMRNAVSIDMAEKAAVEIVRLGNDDDIRVIVVKGAGGKSFVSGQDISEFESLRSTPEKVAHFDKVTDGMYDGMRLCPKPTMAMIQGYCMGGGMALACACDIRLCSEESIFAIPAGRLGIGYRTNFVRWVVEAVGPSVTKEILYTARRYDATEALQIGLVNRVLPNVDLEDYVAEYAATIAENAPLTARATKIVVNEVAKSFGEYDAELCAQVVEDCANSEDFKEGRRAFMEKRNPEFKGN